MRVRLPLTSRIEVPNRVAQSVFEPDRLCSQAGNGRGLPDEVKRDLVPGLRAHPGTVVFLAYVGDRAVGVAVCFGAAVRHVRLIGQIRRGEPYRPAVWSLGVMMAGVLAVLGMVMTAYIVTRGP